MAVLNRLWCHFEEAFIAFLLASMTLVTFVYVILNNLYELFYSLADRWESLSDPLAAVGDTILEWAQAMTWSNALTKVLFAWMIFFGVSYVVRIGGHIGVDALVKLFRHPVQRGLGFIACLFCLGYAALMTVASYEWIVTLYTAAIGAEDLGQYGIMQWHITLIVPIGFALVFVRFSEILLRILKGKQRGLGLADEAQDALKLTEHEAHSQDQEPHQ